MVIENKKASRKIWQFFILAGIAYLALIVTFIVMEDSLWLSIVSAMFFADLLFFVWMNFQYVYFTISDERVILRYYSIVSLPGKEYKSIEFAASRLKGVDFKESVWGLKANLRLSVRTRRGIATFPKVGLSALSVDKRRKIINQLNEQITKNNA
ncbi:hypothetical protein EYV94_19260 [Puteibacter caeruleilacunae]|nr:hypothetical protein EYV94_19260 [Puteibacter caeruleilacunae]